MNKIPLTRGKYTILDKRDYDIHSQFNWCAKPDGDDSFFAVRTGPRPIRKNISLHREIMGCPDGLEVDHINGDPLDNRRSNLRIVTHRQNMQNRRGATRESLSGVRGVRKYHNKWVAKIGHRYIGLYRTKELARAAYIKENRAQYGAFGGVA